METNKIKVDKWVIEQAQMKHTARKYSMGSVAQTYIRKHAAEYGIEDYQKFLAGVRDDPERYDLLTEQEREFADVCSSVGVWATIAACIKPYIPLDEWASFDDGMVEKLSNAVQEVNPHWFQLPESEKKTEELPMKSTESSET